MAGFHQTQPLCAALNSDAGGKLSLQQTLQHVNCHNDTIIEENHGN